MEILSQTEIHRAGGIQKINAGRGLGSIPEYGLTTGEFRFGSSAFYVAVPWLASTSQGLTEYINSRAAHEYLITTTE